MSLQVNKKSKNISHRAIIFIDDTSNDNVFLHDSVHGIRRIFMNHYMELVEAPHDGQYSLQRVNLETIETNKLLNADAKYLQNTVTSIDVPCKSDKVIHAFRFVWYAITGEVMEIY